MQRNTEALHSPSPRTAPQKPPAATHSSSGRHRHHRHQRHHSHHRAASPSGDAATARSSAHHKSRHQDQQHRRNRSSVGAPCGGPGVGVGGSGGGDNDDIDGHILAQAAPAPSLIDQLLINSVTIKPAPNSVCPTVQQQQQQHQHLQPQQQTNDLTQYSNRRVEPASPDNAETAAGKALARQWDVSKQFVVATLINCLSQRMRDLQRTEDLQQASEKLAILAQLRRLLSSVRDTDLTKTLYSDKKRAKNAEAAVGLRQRTVPVDMLRKWSSRENEYHLYWMALLEKSVASLAQCQDSGALRCQLDFALSVVEVRGFPS